MIKYSIHETVNGRSDEINEIKTTYDIDSGN